MQKNRVNLAFAGFSTHSRYSLLIVARQNAAASWTNPSQVRPSRSFMAAPITGPGCSCRPLGYFTSSSQPRIAKRALTRKSIARRASSYSKTISPCDRDLDLGSVGGTSMSSIQRALFTAAGSGRGGSGCPCGLRPREGDPLRRRAGALSSSRPLSSRPRRARHQGRS